jgi:hypothetical protein
MGRERDDFWQHLETSLYRLARFILDLAKTCLISQRLELLLPYIQSCIQETSNGISADFRRMMTPQSEIGKFQIRLVPFHHLAQTSRSMSIEKVSKESLKMPSTVL